MFGSIETLSVSELRHEEYPILTVVFGSFPNRQAFLKSEKNYACCTVHVNLSRSGNFYEPQKIDHSIRIEGNELCRLKYPGAYDIYHQLGTLNVKTGLPEIKELYCCLTKAHDHLSLRRTWIVGAFYLITSMNLDLSYSYSTILGVAPGVPSAAGKVAIAASPWKPVSNDLKSLLAKYKK